MKCEECQELLTEFSLGQLKPEVSAMVRQHLGEGCDVCSKELSRITESWAHLAATLEPVQPSAEVERRLLAMIRGEVPVPAPRSAKKNGERVWPYMLAASLLGIATALVVWQTTPLGPMLAGNLEVVPPDAWAIPQAQPSAKGFQTVSLQPIGRPSGVRLNVIRNVQTHEWHILGTGLPLESEGKVLPFWFEEPDGKFVRSSSFAVDAEGRGGGIIEVSEDVEKSIVAVLLSVEISAEAETPSDTVLFHAKLK
jgi:hypothetical protein